MSHLLKTPMNQEEANHLSEAHAFRRQIRDGAIFADFDTPEALAAASSALRAARMDYWRERNQIESEMGTEQSA